MSMMMSEVLCEQSREVIFYTSFGAVNELVARDEVHHSARCLLSEPHVARLSRLCRWSRRLPVRRAIFVFIFKVVVPISQVSIRTYIYCRYISV